jgi:hypothetical protein
LPRAATGTRALFTEDQAATFRRWGGSIRSGATLDDAIVLSGARLEADSTVEARAVGEGAAGNCSPWPLPPTDTGTLHTSVSEAVAAVLGLLADRGGVLPAACSDGIMLSTALYGDELKLLAGVLRPEGRALLGRAFRLVTASAGALGFPNTRSSAADSSLTILRSCVTRLDRGVRRAGLQSNANGTGMEPSSSVVGDVISPCACATEGLPGCMPPGRLDTVGVPAGYLGCGYSLTHTSGACGLRSG